VGSRPLAKLGRNAGANIQEGVGTFLLASIAAMALRINLVPTPVVAGLTLVAMVRRFRCMYYWMYTCYL